MKIQVISDIHLEFNKKIPFFIKHNSYFVKAPYLFLVGDIGNPHLALWSQFIDWCDENYTQIFYVIGNHEYYGNSFTEIPEFIKKVFITKPKFTLLQPGIIASLEDYKVIGCTLWTDIDIGTALLMNDIQNIYDNTNGNNSNNNKQRITHETLLQEYKKEKVWVEKTLNDLQTQNSNQKIIVATHHLPSMQLIPAKFQNPIDMKYARGFASNLDHIIPYATIWLFGHTHYHVDKMLNETRCYGNAVGYPDESDIGFTLEAVELP